VSYSRYKRLKIPKFSKRKFLLHQLYNKHKMGDRGLVQSSAGWTGVRTCRCGAIMRVPGIFYNDPSEQVPDHSGVLNDFTMSGAIAILRGEREPHDAFGRSILRCRDHTPHPSHHDYDDVAERVYIMCKTLEE
jgi:hypothetical protein